MGWRAECREVVLDLGVKRVVLGWKGLHLSVCVQVSAHRAEEAF